MMTWLRAIRRAVVVGIFCALCVGVASESGIALQAPERSTVRIPAESAGWNRVLDVLLSTLDTADVLALGEAHGRTVDAELRVRLVKHPEFSSKARLILAEDETQVDEELSAAVREINRGLPPANQLRVLIVRTNSAALAVLREQVFGKGIKALVIYGSGHLWHRQGGITSEIQRIAPSRIFVVESLAPPTSPLLLEKVAKLLGSLDRPVLVSLRSTTVGNIAADEVFAGETFFPGATLGDLDDACVFFGGPPVGGTPATAISPARRVLSAGASVHEMFDTSTPVTLKGLVSGVSVIAGEPHAYIMVNATNEMAGPIHQWAIRGDSRETLAKAGWTFPGTIKLGDTIEVLAYAQRPDVLLTALPISAPWIREVVRAGGVAHGIQVTLADGRRLPYGQQP